MARPSFSRLHILAALSFTLICGYSAHAQEKINIDANAATTPFPHFWEKTFGSGRAILALREDYRKDLVTVKQATNFESIRFHGIFDDEVGLYDPDRQTKNPGLAAEHANDASIYNFSYVDEIYDGLLDRGVRPFVEMSFMPEKMASEPGSHQTFFGLPNNSPPKDYAKWDAMIHAFAQHLIDRYGIDEVSKWKFEVWNEPNLDFWAGKPKQATYWALYDHTARTLKAVSPRIQVGGPSTAQAAWVGDFLAHAKSANVPVDFASTHVYANDRAQDVFKTDEDIPRDQMVYRAVKKVHDEIVHSPFPNMPLIFSEYNASYSNEPNVTDTPYIGAWLANNIRLCDGLTASMSYWSFSDVFDEQGVVRTPFYGGFGLIAADNIPKASFNAFSALHKLGERRLPVQSESALATRSDDGKVEVALWNYAAPTGEGAKYTMPHGPDGPEKAFDLHFEHIAANAPVEVLRVDDEHSNAVKAFDAMGRPQGSLSREQVKQLQAAGAMAAPERLHLDHGSLHLTVPAHGLAVLIAGK